MSNTHQPVLQPVLQSVRDTLHIESEAIRHVASTLDAASMEKAVQMLCDCTGKVYVSGCGTSGAAARKIAHTLCCVNRSAAFLNPADAMHGGMGAVERGDVVILLSKGGATAEITNLVAGCHARGAQTIAITENETSKLAQECDLLLKVSVEREPDKFNMLATASTLAVIAVMDAIAICVMERNGFTKDDFSIIHPGGAVGERLLNKKS